MFGAEKIVIEAVGFLPRQRQHLLRSRGKITHGIHRSYFIHFATSPAICPMRLGKVNASVRRMKFGSTGNLIGCRVKIVKANGIKNSSNQLNDQREQFRPIAAKYRRHTKVFLTCLLTGVFSFIFAASFGFSKSAWFVGFFVLCTLSAIITAIFFFRVYAVLPALRMRVMNWVHSALNVAVLLYQKAGFSVTNVPVAKRTLKRVKAITTRFIFARIVVHIWTSKVYEFRLKIISFNSRSLAASRWGG